MQFKKIKIKISVETQNKKFHRCMIWYLKRTVLHFWSRDSTNIHVHWECQKSMKVGDVNVWERYGKKNNSKLCSLRRRHIHDKNKMTIMCGLRTWS
jgi:hypothetical protein